MYSSIFRIFDHCASQQSAGQLESSINIHVTSKGFKSEPLGDRHTVDLIIFACLILKLKFVNFSFSSAALL